MRVVAIVLAAGFSRRLGRPKQTLVFEGETLLDRATRVAREVADDVVIVTRENNPDAEEGMASSVRAGVALAGNDARLLITLCDQPLVTADHLRALIAIDAPIVATGYAGIAGVPAIFAPEFVPELLALRGDRGARAVIERHGARVVFFEDAAVDVDFRTDTELPA
ncbi:MAG: nucleotidyltransferase family protein [Thermoanaerobaculia bacterium]